MGSDGAERPGSVYAFGLARDVPALMRALESGDTAEREEALDWLGSAIWRGEEEFHTATARAVPRLARLAVELPGHRTGLLELLGDLARSAEWHDGREPVRQTVAEALPPLLPFAHDADTDVRSAMVLLIAGCGREHAPPLLPLLRTRLAEESDPLVRGRVVTALAVLEDGDDGRLNELLTDPEPRVVLAAAENLLRTAELPLPGALVDHCARAYAADPHEPERVLWPEPHKLFTDRLLEDPEAALRALAGGVPLALEIADHWRDREADVLPWALRDMEGEAWELYQLAQLTCALPPDLHARVRAHVLPYLAADDPAVRAAAITALAPAQEPTAVEEAVRLVEEAPGPYDTVRAVTAVADAFGAQALPVARAVARQWNGAHPELVKVLTRFPDMAADVVEELTELLARTGTGYPPVAVAVLGRLGPAAGDVAERALRACVIEREHSSVSAVAAVAHHRVGGDPGLALSFFRQEMSAGFVGQVMDWAGELGPAAAPLLPFIEPRLAADGSAVAALAVWRITGRTQDTLDPVAREAVKWGRLYAGLPHPVVTLTQMGLVPRFAVEPLRQGAEASRRLVRDGMSGWALHPDYVVRDAVRELLATARVVD
ncbi:HEAT repeat domain-containing protein [Streptomyces sp. NPDC051677]|uniref:HEAT repeat domain-containing protein n=1 Tax=Streptomyces sp. NPDC051677 TaxID=3365669 RepID=UPI0037D8C01B